MPNYLVRFVQMHESFRIAELKALAKIAGVEIKVLKYDEDVGEKSPLPHRSFGLQSFILFPLAKAK